MNSLMCKNRHRRWPNLNPFKTRSGLTLIELLTVVTLIAILATFVLGTAGYAKKKAAIAKAKSQLETIKTGVENFRTDWGLYPPVDTMVGLVSNLYFKPIADSKKVYIELDPSELQGHSLYDPWGGEYNYLSANPSNNLDSYDLWSTSPDDRSTETLDDIKNW